MAVRPLTGVLRCLRRVVLTSEGTGPTDGELLELYRGGGDEAAFELLLRKHAGMVWSVCRRVLGNVHDAEDAFQATFLVLVRKARSIRPAHMVGSWLHGVAYRTAMNAKANRARRQLGQTSLNESEWPCRENNGELSRLLDEELERLPEKYRTVLILCDLEGRTRKEAARQLGCPEGTVAGRLARARALLAKRLTRQRLTLSAGALATELSQAGTTAPASLIAATMKTSAIFTLGASAGGIPANIVALSKGVLKTMLLDKLKVTGFVLTLVLAGLASTTIGIAPPRMAAAAQQSETSLLGETITPPLNQNRDRDPALQGVWSLQRTMRDGRTLPLKPGSVAVVITNRYLIWKEEDKDRAMTYKVRTNRNPKHIDLMSLEPGPEKGARILGVYDISGDTLVIHESDGLRPGVLLPGGKGITTFIYTRIGGFASNSRVDPLATDMVDEFTPSGNKTWATKLFEAKGPTSHDFGKLPRGKQVTHRFYLKNIYSVPLDITDMRVSCGCVTVTKILKSLLPGEETHVDVRLDTRRFSGPKTITIYVGVQGKGHVSTAGLRVKAESVEDGRAGADSGLRGQIVNVLSDKEQLVEVNIGSDDGVNKQQRLQIFRLKPRAEYLGEMRILTVQPHRAVGRVVTPSRAPIVVGDEVGYLASGKQPPQKAARRELRQVRLNVIVAEMTHADGQRLLSRWSDGRASDVRKVSAECKVVTDSRGFAQDFDKLRRNGAAKILTDASVTTLTGQEAVIVNGAQVASQKPSDDSAGACKVLGSSIMIYPVVLTDGLIHLEVRREMTGPFAGAIFGTGKLGITSDSTQTMRAAARLGSGQSLIIGGPSPEDKESGHREVIILITPELVGTP